MQEEVDKQFSTNRDLFPCVLLNMYITSPRVKETFEHAQDIYQGKAEPYTDKREVYELRDHLMTVFIINNIRRSQEMCTFKLREFANADKFEHQGSCYWIIHISDHKTGIKSKATITCSELEFDALKSWVKYYRPLITPCSGENCFVFPGGCTADGDCCTQSSVSNTSKIMRSGFRRTGIAILVNLKIGTRRVRQVQITGFRKEYNSPDDIRKLAALACHRTDTQDR